MPEGAPFTDGGPTGRVLCTRYQDPLDALWMAAVRRLDRTGDRCGSGDLLAPFLFHEICHGLIPRDPDAQVREAACRRLQAALADRYGLREFLAVPRDGGDGLPADPLRDGPHAAIPLAQRGWLLSRQSPWREVLDEALAATAALAAALQGFPLEPDSLWKTARPVHPLHFGPGTGEHTCRECAWFVPGKRNGHCRHALLERRRDRVAPTTPACNRYEAVLTEADCGACGACCREGFSLVPVVPTDPMHSSHPEWVVQDGWGFHLPRPHGKCVALKGTGTDGEPWRCRAYEDRPHHCRDFDVGSSACLEARRRTAVGP